MNNDLGKLRQRFEGELYFDDTPRHQVQLMAYATDASVYQQKPLAVACPKHVKDIQELVAFALQHRVSLIPRAAGTSLAGQVVGAGIVVDISKTFNRVIEVNAREKWVRVQPGVVRDDLNHHLAPYNLLFGPETSTANRAMIGGMVGNNSCGLHSIVWGAVRDHLLEAEVVLSDGSLVRFGAGDQALSNPHPDFKSGITGALTGMLSEPGVQELIRTSYPKASVVRRNTGYALDSLLETDPFTPGGPPFNLCRLLAGSEGTLAFITEVKLALLDLPPSQKVLLCIHCRSIDEALRANIVALKHRPMASELVDKYIMDFTIGHPEYGANRFFVEGDPAAILMVEFMNDSLEQALHAAASLVSDLRLQNFGYAYPVLTGADTTKAWDIRKAGLGLLRNLRGDAQPVNLIEDCAVAPGELPDYIAELQQVLEKYSVRASYYAHAGAGQLHVEPIINLKSQEGKTAFRNILTETAALVKKFNGSLSGEHGDGRLRGEFIAAVLGQPVYQLFQQVKALFDPHNIFNPGKIVNVPPMDSQLRYDLVQPGAHPATNFDFSKDESILRLAEKCSGSGDCRKTEIAGGLMCPSYMATRREKDTTRARANVLRQFLSNPHDAHPFGHEEIKEVMDLCLSCKGCKTECPSGVDVTKMKAEFLQQYYDLNGVPRRSKLIGNFTGQMALAQRFSGLYNFAMGSNLLRPVLNRMAGFHPARSIPPVAGTTLRQWFRKRKPLQNARQEVLFFCDEFTNYLDVQTGRRAILLLEALGYRVSIPEHEESGRTWLSKGLVRKAAQVANRNIGLLHSLVQEDRPLIGLEPSAIFTLRDEYKDLATDREKAVALARHTFSIEEFLSREAAQGRISKQSFTTSPLHIALHGHCYQKVLSNQDYIKDVLTLPENYSVQVIPSGCCGMAGAFGYEAEHYAVSQQVGELILFPAVRKLPEQTVIAASGTSCRHQIKDGTHRTAVHPVEILWAALNKPGED